MDSHPAFTSSSYFLTKSGSHILDVNDQAEKSDKRNGVHRSVSTPAGNRKTKDVEVKTNETIFSQDSSATNDSHVLSQNGHWQQTHAEINGNVPANIDKKDEDSDEVSDVKKDKNEKPKLKFSEFSSRSKYTFVMLAIANFGAGCGFSLPAPFFPREAEKKGASGTAVGLVFSCFQLVNFIACPVFGNYLTVLGAKFVYTSGILVAGSTAILFGFLDKGPSGTIFIVMSFLVRCIEALGVSAFSTASFAIISNEFPNHIASVFATLETCIGIGLMVGPTIGGALYEVGGFGLSFWVVGAIIVTSGLAIFTCLPIPKDIPAKRQGTVFSLLKSPMVWVTALCIMVGSSGLGFLDPTLSSHLDQFGLSTLAVGLFFVIVPGIYAILAPLWGFISDTKDIQSPLLIGGSFLCALGFLFMGPSPLLPFLPRSASLELWTVTLGLVFYGISVGCTIVPTMKCLVIGAREIGLSDNLNTFGLVSGLFNSLFCLGAFIGPTIGGALVDQIGFYYGSTIIAGFYVVSLIVSGTYFGVRRLRRKQAHVLDTATHEFPSSVSHELSGSEKTPLLPKHSKLRDIENFHSLVSNNQANTTGSQALTTAVEV